MKIDRHNYESFFLLYADNELSAAEKKEVQEFLVQNPDLLHEFELLQQSVLKPDTIVFENKMGLLKPEPLSEALQENLLLLLDNELNDEEKKRTGYAIASDERLAGEWSLLLQTKLQPDTTVVFEDKRSLYRSTRKPVIAIWWWRAAAAAILIGFGTWITASFFIKKQHNDLPVAAANNNQADIKNIASGQQDKKQSTAAIINVDTSAVKIQQETFAGNVTTTDKRNVQPAKEHNNNSLITQNNSSIQPAGNLPGQNFSDTGSNKNLASNVLQTDEQVNRMIKEKVNTNINTSMQPDSILSSAAVRNVYASTAALNESAGEDNDDHILLIPEEKLKKTGVGSFFNRVKKTLKSSSKLASKKSIRIANLEFAIQ